MWLHMLLLFDITCPVSFTQVFAGFCDATVQCSLLMVYDRNHHEGTNMMENGDEWNGWEVSYLKPQGMHCWLQVKIQIQIKYWQNYRYKYRHNYKYKYKWNTDTSIIWDGWEVLLVKPQGMHGWLLAGEARGEATAAFPSPLPHIYCPLSGVWCTLVYSTLVYTGVLHLCYGALHFSHLCPIFIPCLHWNLAWQLHCKSGSRD